MKKTITFFGCFFIFSSSIMLSQVVKSKEMSFSFGPTSTKIKNKNISDDKFKEVDNNNGVNMNLSYNRYKKRVGFGIGLGYSTYKQTIYQKGLFESFSQMDKDGNLYDEWRDSDVTYTNKLVYLDVPVTFHLLLGNSPRFYGIFDIGIVNQFLVAGNYTMNGSVENMGKYATSNPYFNLVSQNNSYYDYKVELYEVSKDDTFKTFNLSGHLSIGMAAAMSDNLFLKIQGFANMGFSDVTAKDLQDKDYENVFGKKSDYQPTKILALGLNIGFAYNLGNVKVKN